MKHSIEACREKSARALGRTHTEESKAKMRGHDNRSFPMKCIQCSSRDLNMCAKYNMTCFDARKTECFRQYMKRKERPDYVKVESQ